MVDSATEAEIAELVKRTEIATTAFMRGEMERYLELTPHVRGSTLFNPFGGEAGKYKDRRESLLAAASYFRSGEAKIELVSTLSSGDMLVLVMIERQHGEVGGLPDQTWPLRVTQVYLREDGEWRLAHRHADPLVKVIGLEHAAEIARG
jgi:ketosteroid isomerase-like protein